MASLWDNEFLDSVADFFTGGGRTTYKATKKIEKAGEDYKKDLEEIAKNTKGAKELYNEGKEVASAAANNKAGIAQRNAKAASMQNSGSRLMSALHGAQAASDASREGYDATASNAAGLAGQMQAQQNALKQAAAQGKYNAELESAGLSSAQARENSKWWRDSAKDAAKTAAGFINMGGAQ